MRFCSQFVWIGLATFAAAQGAATPALSGRITSIVRADPRTGKLVRAVIVTPPATPRKAQAAPTPVEDVGKIVAETARKYDVDPLLVHSVIEVESNYNPFAVSSKGAQGLMQLIPSTARRFGVTNVFDPEENIEGGVRYLKYLSTLFPGDLRLVLAAYNAGESAVVRNNNDVPSYRETREYVTQVGKAYGRKKEAAGRPEPAAKQQKEPEYRPIEAFVDSEGKLHLRTR